MQERTALSQILHRLESILLGACFLSLVFSGCGGKSDTGLVPVQGQVTLNGGPLPEGGNGNVTFSSADGKGNTATGLLDDDGNYRMSTFEANDGVLPGEYKVSVSWTSPGSGDPKTGVLKAPASIIDERFSNPETSGLTATITADGNEDLDFDLKP